MSSGYGRNGGAPSGPTKNRKRNKKYGLNLYQLQKGGPAAPPVPSITTSAQAKPSNGLLLLSKKSATGGGGLLAGKETINDGQSKQTENDALFAKAQGGDGHGGGTEGEANKAAIPAWGNKEKTQSVDLSMEELTLKSPTASQLNDKNALKYDEKTSLLVLAPKGSLSKQKSVPSTSCATPENNGELKQISSSDKPTEKDQQKQYMSKLAKERASRLQSEEEARITQQKERAAKRLEELEAKRLEQKKKQARQPKQKKTQRNDGPPMSIIIGKDAPKRPPPMAAVPSKIYSRKEFSQPSTVLEPLGKPKKVLTHSDNLTSNQSDTVEAKNEGKKKLYDPNRPYSSLVGGKSKPEAKSGGSVKSGKSEESSAAKDSRSSHGVVSKAPAGKEKPSSAPVRMVTLNSFEDRDRGVGRGTPSGAGPRMLFDPTSGSLVAAPSGEVQHQQQLSPVGGAKSGLKKSSMPKQPFPKPPVGSSKIDPKPKQPQKKLDNKSRSPSKKSRMKFPHTRGVKYKKDERGNYISIDQCEADCGYGQHSVPGGRIKNATAYAKLSEQNKAMQQQKKSNKLNADAPAFFGFQIQKDSTSLQQQTDFEVQQQRILEDAWASLEEAAPSREELHTEEDVHTPQRDKAGKSQEDEYAAALAISPTMIGLGPGKDDEPFDVSKFALESDSTGLPANRFTSLGGGGSRLLGSSTWGTSASANTGATLGGIAGLSGWNFDPRATDFTPASKNTDANEGANENSAEQSTTNNTFINLNGWGSTTFDSFAFGGKYHDNDSSG